MTRPVTHHEQSHVRCCGSCVFSKLVAYKLDLLCFYGDKIEIHGQSEYPVTAPHVYLDGVEVGILEGDAYDKVWAERVVDSEDVCDKWSDTFL